MGCAHAIGCSSGTDALYLALLALNIGHGDEVITSPFTFFATIEAICLVGATPVFADICEDTFTLNPASVEERVSPRSRAVIPVSIFGQTADMDAINRIAAINGMHVIEDAAQSFGARYNGGRSCNLSEIACTSFFPSKPLGCYGDGGALFTNFRDLADRFRLLRNHGTVGRHEHECLGVNSRLDAVQAAVLRAKLPHLSNELMHRRVIARRYEEALQGVGDLRLPVVASDRSSTFAQFTIRTSLRDSLVDWLTRHGVPTAIHYPKPAYCQEALGRCLPYRPAPLPIVERICREVVSLPMCAFLSEARQQEIIDAIRAFYEGGDA